MTMPGEPTLGEIARSLESLRHDVRAALDERLRSDVYRAEQALIESRISALEAARISSDEERRALRRQMTLAVVAAVLAFLANFLGGLIQIGGVS